MMAPDTTELHFYRASIYSNATRHTDKLKVRILPDMVGEDEGKLPIFPMFNSCELIHGVAEDEVHDYKKSTVVWGLATNDFHFGYVFCEAGPESQISAKKSVALWPYSTFFTHISRMNMNTNSFDYKELKVLYHNTPYYNMYQWGNIKNKRGLATAGCIDVTNVRTGERWIMLTSGTAIGICQDGLHFRVGSPSKDRATIDMTANKIYIKAQNIILDAQHTSLGRHGMNLAGFQGPIPVGVDGQALVPLYEITC